ncbi:MAG: ribosome-associated translation inhibitor RaiA [Deltaproteobacteria bacterium]|nr:ribosome-associated translation inhibitor RaiA [Deltaproteobacteria bacterium]
MQTSVTFKNLDSSENLKKYVQDKLNRFDKFLYNPAEANVVLSVEKFRHIAEINIIGDRLNINGKEETVDMYSAIDIVLDKLEKQIKKSKQKNRERRSGTKAREKGIIAEDTAHMDFETTREIKVKNIEYKPMDLVFTNARTEKVNVLYQRRDGHYGLIEPTS